MQRPDLNLNQCSTSAIKLCNYAVVGALKGFKQKSLNLGQVSAMLSFQQPSSMPICHRVPWTFAMFQIEQAHGPSIVIGTWGLKPIENQGVQTCAVTMTHLQCLAPKGSWGGCASLLNWNWCMLPSTLALNLCLASVLGFAQSTGDVRPGRCQEISCRSRQSPMLLQVRHGLTAKGLSSDCQTTVPGEKCYQEILANDSYIFADQGHSCFGVA